MDAGKRKEIVFSEGFKWGKTARLALLQSIYSAESSLAQNSRSSFSVLKVGIFFFCISVFTPLFPAHVPGRNHPYLPVAQGKSQVQGPLRVRLPKSINPFFLLRMPDIIRQ